MTYSSYSSDPASPGPLIVVLPSPARVALNLPSSLVKLKLPLLAKL